jgi:hypothetical protein
MVGNKKRLKNRVNALATALIEATTESQFSSIPDSDLFVLDTTPDPSIPIYSKKELQHRKRQQQCVVEAGGKKRKKVILSEKDLRQVQKILLRKADKKNQPPKQAKQKGVYDLWQNHPASEEDDSEKKAKKEQQQPKVAIDIAHSGQSYRPDQEMHQNIVGEALAIELRRNEAELYNKTPIGSMSEETLAVLVGDDDEDEDDGDNTDEYQDSTTVQPKKVKEKLTRAQRNKRRRAKEMQVKHESQKRTKKLLNSVNNLPTIAKELVKEELVQQSRKEELNRLKEEAKSKPLGKNLHEKLVERDPIKAPSLPVVLQSDLKEGGGSLRAVKPKGDLLSERLHSLVERNLANSKRSTKTIVQGKRRKTVKRGMEYLLL